MVAAGKAAFPMAEQYVTAGWPCAQGIIISPDPCPKALAGFEFFQGRHPIPDENGVAATHHILEEASKLGPDDLLVLLLSGGASALLTAPAPDLTLARLKALTADLLASGAAIEEINTVRKHLSRIKGGRLATAAAPARCLTFAISDVTGNDPSVIASGPTWPDETTSDDAKNILARYKIPGAKTLARSLLPSPTITNPEALKADYHLIATPEDALTAAASHVQDLGLAVHDLGTTLKGEARIVAKQHADLARKLAATGAPALLLSGGELTVTGAPPQATGGPNHEYALAFAHAMAHADMSNIHGFAADTDGKDGNTGAAGAFWGPDTLTRAKSRGLDAEAALRDHLSGSFFKQLGDAHVIGSTGTNVNDFRAILINPEGAGR